MNEAFERWLKTNGLPDTPTWEEIFLAGMEAQNAEVERLREKIVQMEHDEADMLLISNMQGYDRCRDKAKVKIAELNADNARLREVVEEIVQWSEAYPIEVFPEPDPVKVDEVCKTLGFRIDSISAMILRQAAKRWGNIARAALAETGGEG